MDNVQQVTPQDVQDMIRRDHEQTIAMWQAEADAAAAEGYEKSRALYQELADNFRQLKFPWEEGSIWKKSASPRS